MGGEHGRRAWEELGRRIDGRCDQNTLCACRKFWKNERIGDMRAHCYQNIVLKTEHSTHGSCKLVWLSVTVCFSRQRLRICWAEPCDRGPLVWGVAYTCVNVKVAPMVSLGILGLTIARWLTIPAWQIILRELEYSFWRETGMAVSYWISELEVCTHFHNKYTAHVLGTVCTTPCKQTWKHKSQHIISFENTIYKTQLQMQIGRAKHAKERAALKSTSPWWSHRRTQLNL